MTVDKSLVVLSLPFQRLIRSHLSPLLLETFTRRADVIIVSPFAENSGFVRQYAGEGISHLLTPIQDELPWLLRKSTAVSSILRVRGYWRRNRQHIPYYWATRHIGFGENGADTVAPAMRRWIMDFLAFIGTWSRAWKLWDQLIGSRSYDFLELSNITRRYRHVTLIQAASWGFQDQALGWIGRKHNWRTVLIPYTTDQLMTNGYLYSDFDAVCVKGPTERRFAEKLHAVPDDRIVELGSLSCHSDRYVCNRQPVETTIDGSAVRILYAGSTSTYFPTESEFGCLEHILDAVESGQFGNAEITYRPIGQTAEIKKRIEDRFHGRRCLDIQYASPTIFGLEQYTHAEWFDSLSKHIEDVSGFDIAIMAGVTSLALDLSLFGTPAIAYWHDKTGTLDRRATHLMFDRNGLLIGLEEIPVVRRKAELVPLVKELMADPNRREQIAQAIAEAWDYNPGNLAELLEQVVLRDILPTNIGYLARSSGETP
jgi:hypothetical protein